MPLLPRGMVWAEDILWRLGRGEAISERVVVVTAHPDDETVGLGGRLAKLRRLTLIQATDGAPLDMEDACRAGFSSRETYAQARRIERGAALTALGAAPVRLIDYALADKGCVLELAGLVEQLTRDLEGAEVVLTHAYEGGHPDHDAVALAVQRACASMTRSPLRLEFAGYCVAPGGQSFNAFHPDAEHAALTTTLDEAERARKADAFAAYATQAETLAQFPLDREAYRIAPTYDFTRPPPPGETLYDRWGWSLTGETWRAHARAALSGLAER